MVRGLNRLMGLTAEDLILSPFPRWMSSPSPFTSLVIPPPGQNESGVDSGVLSEIVPHPETSPGGYYERLKPAPAHT